MTPKVDTRRYHVVNTNNAQTDSKHTDSKHADSKHADSKHSRKVEQLQNQKVEK